MYELTKNDLINLAEVIDKVGMHPVINYFTRKEPVKVFIDGEWKDEYHYPWLWDKYKHYATVSVANSIKDIYYGYDD
jgi:hypothetical protein